MPAPPFKVKAVYEYTSPHEDDLHFPNGQIITVTEEEDDDWYSGEYVDAEGVKQEGIFPRNFVEKYEPQAPPRPVRSARPKKEAEQAAPVQRPAPELAPAPVVAEPVPEPVLEPIVAETPVAIEKVVERIPPKIEPYAPAVPKQAEKHAAPAQVAPRAAAPPAGRSPPAEEPDKPTGSFRDRIAAFNKSAAPPPAPFKLGGLGGGSSFIKKPFVPPPPSKNAYIPPPRDTPVAKIYRREEDLEIAARETENQESAEKAGLTATGQEGEEDQPKPTSLKERIALLQKQQAEQAARHTDAAQKKEKPKRPAKKRTDSQPVGEQLECEEVPLEKQESHETVGRQSIDSSRDETARQQPQKRRKSSKGPPVIPAPALEADGNDADMSGAGDETEEPDTGLEDSDAKPTVKSHAPPPPARGPVFPAHEPDVGDEEDVASDREEREEGEDDEEQGEDEEEEEEVDPEVRRKEEIRARMAKMSGGMGMHGMFGPPGGMPIPMAGAGAAPKKKKAASGDARPSGEYGYDESSPTSSRAPQVPIMALPGLSKVRTPEEMPSGVVMSTREPEEIPDVEDTVGAVAPAPSEYRPAPQRSSMSYGSFKAPAVPGGRPAPPLVPVEPRPAPVATALSPSAGSISDDELSTRVSAQTPTGEAPPKLTAAPNLPIREEKPIPSALSTAKAGSYEPSPVSPTTPGANKRASRVPPIPGSSPVVGAGQTRAPPPPPPTGSLSRASTGDARFAPVPTSTQREETDEEVTEYEGDYDTDIAPTEPHKDALKAQARESSIDDESARSSFGSPAGPPPPLPPVAAPRGVPPPLPSQPPPHARQSLDMPRAVPPPPPPPKQETSGDYDEDDDEYDPFKYTAPKSGVPVSAATVRKVSGDSEDLYSTSPPRHAPPPHDGRAPPPPPRDAAPPILPTASVAQAERAAPPPPPRELALTPTNRAAPRQSVDVQRSTGPTRRSTDLNRMSMDHGFIANDVDLAEGSLWWTNPSGVPPAFHGRKDLLHEAEESTVSKRGGKFVTTKDLYVLFPDYSQTVVTVQFDPQNPSDATFEQRHEQPPSRLRQDQLEEAHERFGSRIHDAVVAKKEVVVADGTPAGLILELLKPFKDALLPIGTRAYGALVYSNIGNSLTSQFDEIRPGDIITLRNAKFQGKHGPMHAKYTAEVGRGEGHVGVVAEWDGPKKKVRAWEQGRESKKVKLESFKLDDLRSGEVKIWRVMPRSWVGWEGENSK